ncbi:hypothetical protein GQ53DRAFT_818289 [Thozetella sp. PMI_491]|nr:hypothetical protein GQ53DRAFT_826934 [Thozetella sp. PMI_491]KAH8896986.1 hypothetical protein GQ53DRAFT_818289 [Thozetella sp. PMI_491]
MAGAPSPMSMDYTRQAGQPWIEQHAAMLGINWDQLPQLPVWAGLFGHTQERYHAAVLQSTSRAAVLLKRRLEPAERDAMASAIASHGVSLAYVDPVYVATAFAFERRGHKRLRFPFYTPTSIDPYRFPSKRIPVLSGQLALWTWHGIRFGSYLFMSKLFMAPLATYIIASRTFNTLVRDPSLAAFHDAMKKLTPKDARMLDQQLRQKVETIYEYPADSNAQDSSASYFDGQGQEQDSETTAISRSAWDRYRGPGSSQRPLQGQQGQQSPGWSPPAPPAPPSEVDDDAYLFDDASPVAPAARSQQSGPASSASTAGSAWDRIRANNQPSQQRDSQAWAQRRFQASQQAGQASQDNQGGDAYSYSQDEQEKGYAKQQAQKDFDAMIERERQRDSEEGSRRG